MSEQQHYVGTKIIEAWPLMQDGHPGYGVKYEDGYISWSPKATFEAAYLDLGHIGHLQPHQQRLVAEKAQLDDRLGKLIDFTLTDKFAGLNGAEQDRLRRQREAMRAYSDVLEERIAAFS